MKKKNNPIFSPHRFAQIDMMRNCTALKETFYGIAITLLLHYDIDISSALNSHKYIHVDNIQMECLQAGYKTSSSSKKEYCISFSEQIIRIRHMLIRFIIELFMEIGKKLVEILNMYLLPVINSNSRMR